MIVRDDHAMFRAGVHFAAWRSVALLLNIIAVLGLAASILITSASHASAQTKVTELTGPRLPETLQGHIDYFLDPSKAMTLAQVLAEPDDIFSPVETVFPDFGYVDQHIWLRLVARNETDDVRSWRLHFRENFKQFLAVHIVRQDGTSETTYDVGLDDGFDKGPSSILKW